MTAREMWRGDVVAEIEERQGSAAITVEKTGERYTLNAYSDEGELTFSSFLGDEPKAREFILESYSALGLDADKYDGPRLPTTPGAYHDEDGDLWILDPAGKWEYVYDRRGEYAPEDYLPFVRLVPETTD